MGKSWHLSERLRNLLKSYSRLGVQEAIFAPLSTFIKDLLCTKNTGESDSKEEDPFCSINYYSVQ